MKSIRGRLRIVLVAVMTLVLAGGGASIYGLVRRSLVEQLDRALVDQASTLASLVTFESNELLFDEGDAAHEAFEDAP